MNIAYIIDLNSLLKKEDVYIPYLDRMYYYEIPHTDLSKTKVLEIRDDVMRHTKDSVDKHLFFFVINNDNSILDSFSNCLKDIQNDHINFNREHDEIHVVCNFIMQEGFDIAKFQEKLGGLLTKNDVCVYSWFLDKYDYNSVKPLSDGRRAHAIARFVGMMSKHYGSISTSLLPMTQDTETAKPIFNFFGDACVFFDEKKRTDSVRNYYCYKSIQHLLNLSDNSIVAYMNVNVAPYVNDQKALDKRIEASSENFLKEERVPIEASLITEKTQGVLLKSSDNDEEYLVNASDNQLVFLQELRNNNDWQLAKIDLFLTTYQKKVGLNNEIPEVVSNDFLDKLYNEKFIIHEKGDFNIINNKISNRRKTHVDRFKQVVDNHLNSILNQRGDENYVLLQEILTKEETLRHRSNIDNGIAFLEYLESGKGDYLTDQDVAVGDVNFQIIKDALEKEESIRRQEYEDKKNAIKDKYEPKEDGQPSKVKEEIGIIDQIIKEKKYEKTRCDFQIDHWIDEDADKKLTARTRSVLAFGCGVLTAIIWAIVSIRYLSDFMKDYFEHYDKFQWEIFGGLILTGIIVGLVFIAKAIRRRKEAEEALDRALQRKRNYMNTCVEEMKDVAKKHYEHLLSYHGLKTMRELMLFAAWKIEDLVNFKKTLFKMMLQYRLSVEDNAELVWEDDNTIELKDPNTSSTILFGNENNRNNIPYCFAQDNIVLSNAFADYKRKRARWETIRSGFSHTSLVFDQAVLENEIIPCMREHEGSGVQYTTLKETPVLPVNTTDVEMDDVHQGQCGDCYFMATLAAIAKVNPDYIIGENGMVENLGNEDEHRFFRVKFYDKDRNRVNVDVDNRFWNHGGQPLYAKQGKSCDPEGNSYDPWVMVVEKAWAKANDNGYDGIVGSNLTRRVEYSFAVTGKPAFYCNTENVPDGDKLREMMRKHFCDDKLPITLYSVHEDDARFADPYIVHFHAYALQSVNDDGTFNIFNPWNDHSANENVKGKHYENVDIKFIKDNFDVVVFFGIQEADFDSFERDLTQNAAEDEVTKDIEKVLHEGYGRLTLSFLGFEDLLSEEIMRTTLTNAVYLFSRNRIADQRGQGNSGHLLFIETCKDSVCNGANQKTQNFLRTELSPDIRLQDALFRDDDKLSLTLLRLSPHYVLENFG